MYVLIALELPGEPLDRITDAGRAIRLDAGHCGTVGHAGDTEADAVRALRQHRDANDGEIAMPARDLAESRPAFYDREPHRNDQLIAFARGRQHALLKLTRRQHARALVR